MARVSLKPSDAVQAGLIDDVDVTLKKVRFTDEGPENYNTPEPTLFLQVTTEVIGEGEVYEQYYSAGKLEYFEPANGGREIEAVGSRTGLANNCNAVQFIDSIINAGFKEADLGEDISVFDGLQCHVLRQPQKGRGGIPSTDSEGRPRTILLVTKILEGKAPAASQGKAAGKAKGKAAAAAPEGFDEYLEAAVAGIMDDGSVSRKKLATLLMKQINMDKKAGNLPEGGVPKNLLNYAVSKDFLEGEERPWVIDEDGDLIGV